MCGGHLLFWKVEQFGFPVRPFIFLLVIELSRNGCPSALIRSDWDLQFLLHFLVEEAGLDARFDLLQ